MWFIKLSSLSHISWPKGPQPSDLFIFPSYLHCTCIVYIFRIGNPDLCVSLLHVNSLVSLCLVLDTPHSPSVPRETCSITGTDYVLTDSSRLVKPRLLLPTLVDDDDSTGGGDSLVVRVVSSVREEGRRTDGQKGTKEGILFRWLQSIASSYSKRLMFGVVMFRLFISTQTSGLFYHII